MLSPDAARSILAFDFTQADRDRMNCLASKARNGSLSKEEDEELETYLRVGDLIAILQSKARQSLQFPKDEMQFDPSAKPIWAEFDEILAGVPKEELNKLPVDAASNLDHYLYSSPLK